MSATEGTGTDHVVRWKLGRCEWLATEWPAILVWCGWAAFLMLLLATAVVLHSAWWLVLLPVWWVVGGGEAAGLCVFLVRGGEANALVVGRDGTMFVSQGRSEPVYAHWRAFVDQGRSYLLWGADGRYRLVIPKRALSADDHEAIHERLGIDLTALGPGEEARLG